MNHEYVALKSLINEPGWPVLQALWAQQHAQIVRSMRNAGRKPQESAWRYYAGQQEGFELAITQVERALVEMEKIAEQAGQKSNVDELLESIKKQGEPPK